MSDDTIELQCIDARPGCEKCKEGMYPQGEITEGKDVIYVCPKCLGIRTISYDVYLWLQDTYGETIKLFIGELDGEMAQD